MTTTTKSIRILFYSTCSIIDCEGDRVYFTIRTIDADLETRALIYFCTTEGFQVDSDVVHDTPTRNALFKYLSDRYSIRPYDDEEKLELNGWTMKKVPRRYLKGDRLYETDHWMMCHEMNTKGFDRSLHINPKDYDVLIKSRYLGDTTDCYIDSYLIERWQERLRQEGIGEVPVEFKQFMLGVDAKAWDGGESESE